MSDRSQLEKAADAGAHKISLLQDDPLRYMLRTRHSHRARRGVARLNGSQPAHTGRRSRKTGGAAGGLANC